MAGGVGSRFWPLSRRSRPKQFLDILGTGSTLIRSTFERFKSYGIPVKNFLVVTNMEYENLVKEQLTEFSDNQILGEPYLRNTAPAVAYALTRISNQTAKVIVTPADHLVTDVVDFYSALDKFVESNEDSIHILGVHPDYPSTSYGYLEVDKSPDEFSTVPVKKFKEKPDLDTAKSYIDSGKYYWNSGLFMGSVEAFKGAYERNCPDIWERFDKLRNNTVYDRSQTYQTCPSISFDYAILEKESNVVAIVKDKCRYGWNDLGTWKGVMNLSGSSRLQVGANKDKKIMVVNTTHDLIVVDTDSALLIMDSDTTDEKFKSMMEEVPDEFK